MDAAKQYTLSDLAKIALGSSTLTKYHIRVLQTLLMVLLHKLDCTNETVRIVGFPAQCVKDILDKSQEPLLDVAFNDVRNFQKYFDLLPRLELRTKEIRIKMNKHFDEIRKKCATVIFSPKFWDLYAQPTEDLCTLYRRENRDFCVMARNPTFNKEIRLRMAQPIVERMHEFEHILDSAGKKLKIISTQADETQAKLKLIEPIIGEIESSRQVVDKQWQTVRETMEEIQQMLACKLDRITLPAIRKYLEHRFDTVEQHIAILKQRENDCPPVMLLDVTQKDTCLSCSRYEELKPLPVLDIKLTNDKMCECNLVSKEPTILQRMDRVKVKSYRVVAVPLKSSLVSYDETQASAITQDFRDKGDFVQLYTSYSKFGLQDKMHIKPLITVAETSRGRSTHRRLKSFNPINSHTIMMDTPQRKSKSRFSLRAQIPSKLLIADDQKETLAVDAKVSGQKYPDARPKTTRSVNVSYI